MNEKNSDTGKNKKNKGRAFLRRLSARDLALISLFFGIDAVFFTLIAGWAYLWARLMGLLCAVCGVIAAVGAKKKNYRGGMLSAGLILSVVSVCIALLAIMTCVSWRVAFGCVSALMPGPIR